MSACYRHHSPRKGHEGKYEKRRLRTWRATSCFGRRLASRALYVISSRSHEPLYSNNLIHSHSKIQSFTQAPDNERTVELLESLFQCLKIPANKILSPSGKNRNLGIVLTRCLHTTRTLNPIRPPSLASLISFAREAFAPMISLTPFLALGTSSNAATTKLPRLLPAQADSPAPAFSKRASANHASPLPLLSFAPSEPEFCASASRFSSCFMKRCPVGSCKHQRVTATR